MDIPVINLVYLTTSQPILSCTEDVYVMAVPEWSVIVSHDVLFAGCYAYKLSEC